MVGDELSIPKTTISEEQESVLEEFGWIDINI